MIMNTFLICNEPTSLNQLECTNTIGYNITMSERSTAVRKQTKSLDLRNPLLWAIGAVEGIMIYYIGHQLQHYFYSDKSYLPEDIAENLKPIGTEIEFHLLNGQTSMTSFGAGLGAIFIANAYLSFFENASRASEHSTIANLLRSTQYIVPAVIGIINTILEVKQALAPPYPDNWGADIVAGWMAAALAYGTLFLNRRTQQHSLAK